MNKGIPISQEEADKLLKEGIAAFFDLLSCSWSGYFEVKQEARNDSILVITDEGNFIKARRDLVKSRDGVFVGFVENGEDIPNFWGLYLK